MPALTLSTEKVSRLSTNAGTPADLEAESPRSATPPRPPFSPVTPVLSQATLASRSSDTELGDSRPAFIPELPTLPISEADNTDVIALRSALSILQVQRKNTLQDIRQLQQMKKAAATAPEAFAQAALSGNLRPPPREGVLNLPLPTSASSTSDKMDVEGQEGTQEEQTSPSSDPQFGKFPHPQIVVRCPPINWAKYHIVGAPLDRMHDEQIRAPTAGEPRRDETAQRAPDHVVAAPYRPFVDKLSEPPIRTRSGTKKG
jgi:hypothetical protein